MNVRRITAEFVAEDEVMVLWPEGHVTADTPAGLVRHVKRQNRRIVRKGVDAMVVIDWRNTPDGFTPPE